MFISLQIVFVFVKGISKYLLREISQNMNNKFSGCQLDVVSPFSVRIIKQT